MALSRWISGLGAVASFEELIVRVMRTPGPEVVSIGVIVRPAVHDQIRVLLLLAEDLHVYRRDRLMTRSELALSPIAVLITPRPASGRSNCQAI